MIMWLWKYVSTFSNLSGEGLRQIYSKLKVEQEDEVGPSHVNGASSSDPGSLSGFHYQRGGYQNSGNFQTDPASGKSEVWKRRRRYEMETYSPVQPPIQRPLINGIRTVDPSSQGILGAAPPDARRLVNNRHYRVRQPRQDFSSNIKWVDAPSGISP